MLLTSRSNIFIPSDVRTAGMRFYAFGQKHIYIYIYWQGIDIGQKATRSWTMYLARSKVLRWVLRHPAREFAQEKSPLPFLLLEGSSRTKHLTFARNQLRVTSCRQRQHHAVETQKFHSPEKLILSRRLDPNPVPFQTQDSHVKIFQVSPPQRTEKETTLQPIVRDCQQR